MYFLCLTSWEDSGGGWVTWVMAERFLAGDFLAPTISWIPPVPWIFFTFCCFATSAAVTSLAVSLLCMGALKHSDDSQAAIKCPCILYSDDCLHGTYNRSSLCPTGDVTTSTVVITPISLSANSDKCCHGLPKAYKNLCVNTLSGPDLGGVRWVWTNPPFCWFIRLTGSLLLQAVFDTQRWRASPVWLLYNLLSAIQFNVHAVQFFYLVQLTKASFN